MDGQDGQDEGDRPGSLVFSSFVFLSMFVIMFVILSSFHVLPGNKALTQLRDEEIPVHEPGMP